MSYYCSECNEECEAIKVDYGIGHYEFWGATGCHENWQWVSECCEGDLMDEPIGEDEDE